MQNQFGEELEMVVQVLQVSLAPVFLLAALSTLLSVLTMRISRVVDRSHILRNAQNYSDLDRAEVAVLVRRSKLLRSAMILAVAAGVTICAIISLLFVMGLTSISRAIWIEGLFVGAMLLMSGALISFLLEIELAGRQLANVHSDLAKRLENDSAD